MQVALFGGSFDPPHVGHVLAVAYALATRQVDEVLVVPVFSHPFDKGLAPFERRVAMVQLAFGDLRRTSVSTVESSLEVPSLTIRTLEHLARLHPDRKLELLVGADVLLESSKWVGWDRIRNYAELVVLGRIGVTHPDAPAPVLPNVSSTRIRSLLKQRGDARAESELARSVPQSVLRYIEEHRLYR